MIFIVSPFVYQIFPEKLWRAYKMEKLLGRREH
jgi:hypothetical protein